MKHSPGPVMLDVAGKQLNDDDIRRLSHPMTGGVVCSRVTTKTGRNWSR